jgi:hypothetical protein
MAERTLEARKWMRSQRGLRRLSQGLPKSSKGGGGPSQSGFFLMPGLGSRLWIQDVVYLVEALLQFRSFHLKYLYVWYRATLIVVHDENVAVMRAFQVQGGHAYL